MPFKRPKSPNSMPDKSSDKSAKVDVCVKCNETVVENCISCDWCSEWEHISCASIQQRDFKLCIYENVAFFFAIVACQMSQRPFHFTTPIPNLMLSSKRDFSLWKISFTKESVTILLNALRQLI